MHRLGSANLVGEEKLRKARIPKSSTSKAQGTCNTETFECTCKKGWTETIAAKRLAQKTVTDTASAKAMAFVCARICGPVKAASSQLAQIHAVVTVCASVINVSATLNSKEMTAQYDSVQMHALVMENVWIKRTTSVNVQMVSPVKTVAGRNAQRAQRTSRKLQVSQSQEGEKSEMYVQ